MVADLVGRLAPQKDHATLIRAAARVVAVDPTVRFLVVGDHTDTEAARGNFRTLAQLVEELRMTGHVIFTGFRDDIPQLLSGLDVSVLATNFEGFGLVIVEAMAQGTPAIATDSVAFLWSSTRCKTAASSARRRGRDGSCVSGRRS